MNLYLEEQSAAKPQYSASVCYRSLWWCMYGVGKSQYSAFNMEDCCADFHGRELGVALSGV